MTAEQRKSYRCPSADDTQQAVIQVGQREVVVVLTNQSAGGFSVTAKGDLRVREGKVLLMRTSAGWFQAQVIHKQTGGGQTCLGLVRLADLPDPRDAQLVKRGGPTLEHAGTGPTSAGPSLLLAIVAGLAFWGFMLHVVWFRGSDAAAEKRVDFGAYLSRAMERVTPTFEKSPATGAHAADAISTVE
ncbi:MAG TPA: hypothetical protein VMM76_21820 [Pirellulaceae bacterium]|nr:hypothetical protein [Pirellulaceae bacterium]